ncbi:MAG: S1C family serine protease [Ardenticatenia bacterium]|nr:S1C family serine protease [Ardenticatenia bacterium]
MALLRAQEEWLSALYAEVSQSVVHITTRAYRYNFFLEVVPLEGTGSGFLWDDQGYVVTNYHVIKNARGGGHAGRRHEDGGRGGRC